MKEDIDVTGDEDTDDEFYSEMMEVPKPRMTTATATTNTRQSHSDGTNNTDHNNHSHATTTSTASTDHQDRSMETITRSYAIQALALTVQDWNSIGQSSDPTIAEISAAICEGTTTKTNVDDEEEKKEDAILEQCVHRVTSLFFVRIVALVLHRQHQQHQHNNHDHNHNGSSHPQRRKSKKNIIDLSTSGICRQILIVDHRNHYPNADQYDELEMVEEDATPPPWSVLTRNMIQQLEQYVRCILRQYATSKQIPFHNRTHAVTVVTNCNKLIDVLLDPNNEPPIHCTRSSNNKNNVYQYNEDHHHPTSVSEPPPQQQSRRPVITYGIRKDPLLVFALLYAALIHDVQHEGKLNSQLVVAAATPSTTTTMTTAALLYNDQSIQEMRSLRIAFEEFLKDEYTDLRSIIFQTNHNNMNHPTLNEMNDPSSAYRYFRTAVISAVLSTDLSSPERMAVSRSKWKEAFFVIPHPQTHTLHPPKQQRAAAAAALPVPANRRNSSSGKHQQHFHRRASAASNESKPRIIRPMSYHRRGSNYSEMSEITTDEGNEPLEITEYVPQQQLLSSSIHIHRRNSVTSEISAGSYQQRRWNPNKGPYQSTTTHYRQRRRSSVQSDVSSDCESSEVAVDSVALMYNKQQGHANTTTRYGKDEASVDSIVSDTIDSYVLRTTKVVKVKREVEFKKQLVVNDQPDVMIANDQRFVPDESNATDIRNDIAASSSTFDQTTPQRTLSAETDGSTSFVSYPTGSIAVIQKRLEGAPKTRRRATHNNNADDDDDDPPDHAVVDDLEDTVADPCVIDETNGTKIAKFDVQLNLLSPPSSDSDDDDDDYEKQRKELYSSPPSKQIVKPIFPSTNNNHYNNTADRTRNHVPGIRTGPARMITRRASTGAISRFGSLTDLRIDENHSNNGESNTSYNDNDEDDLYNRNNNNKSKIVELPEIPKYRKRLGIRRSMDLSGEAIEFYPRRTSIGNMSNISGNESQDGTNNDEDEDDSDEDDTDYIKASAIIEALLRMADVGHFYQNWHNMTVWSARMFQERMLAEPSSARQDDIYTNWFNNQILIIDSYLKPLAVQLDEAGVLGECHGRMLVQNVEDIRRHWMIYGYEWSQKLIHDMPKP